MDMHVGNELGKLNPYYYNGLSELAQDYDVFLIEALGVVHDGVAPYCGSRDCLRQLKALGKQVVVLSESGDNSSDINQNLRLLGISEDMYDEVLSTANGARSRFIADLDPDRILSISHQPDGLSACCKETPQAVFDELRW